MKKFLFVALGFALSLANAQATDLIDENPGILTASGATKSRLQEFTKYHNLQMETHEHLTTISQMFDWKDFASALIKMKPLLSNEEIEFEFIKGCAQSMINSEDYFSNDFKFFLVEGLDPVVRNFMK